MAPTVIPEVLWAQRSSAIDAAKNLVYLTFNAAEIIQESLKVDLSPTTVSFSGQNTKGINYAVDLELYAEIDPEEIKKHITSRGVDLILRKREKKEEYWPRLLKDSKRMHFLKTDFDKWVDEEEQEEKGELGLGDGGFGDGGFGGLDDGMGGGLDFSKLAASQGLGDLSGIPTGTGGGSDDEDEDMPELEDNEPQVPKDEEGAKAEEEKK